MWGLWLVVSTPEMHQHQAAAACWLAGSWPQSCTKIISFWQNSNSKHTTFQQQPADRLWQCAMPSHSTIQMELCAQGLCPYNISGMLGSGIKDQDQFLQKSDNRDDEGTNTFLPKKSGHLQNGGVTDHAGSREVLTLCSGQFVVPGAHDIDWVLGAPNFV